MAARSKASGPSLQGIGIDAALLAMPAAPSSLADAATWQGGWGPANFRGQPGDARELASEKHFAWLPLVERPWIAVTSAIALTIARQAESLKVPEKDFAAGEPRVWQLLLDAESAARRSGDRA